MLRGIWALMALVIVLLMVGVPVAMAQDEVIPTEEVPSVDVVPVAVDALPTYEERATVTLRDAVLAILFATGATLGTVIVVLAVTSGKLIALVIERLYQSVPSYLQPAAANAIGAGLDKLDEVSKTTKFTWDDEAVAVLKEELAPVIVGYVADQLRLQTADALNKFRARVEAREVVEDTP